MNRGMRGSTIAVGVAFGFLVTGSGLGNYTTIHQALLLRSWYLFAVFGSAVAVAAVGLAIQRQTGTTSYGGRLRVARAPARPHHFYGAAIFGAGFGLTGTCPGSAVAMVATGGLGGLLVLVGLVGGMWLRGLAERPVTLGRDPGDISTIEDEGSVTDARQAWQAMRREIGRPEDRPDAYQPS